MALAPRVARARGDAPPREGERDAARRPHRATPGRDPRPPRPRLQAEPVLAAGRTTAERPRADPVRATRGHARPARSRRVPRRRAEAGDHAGVAAMKLPVTSYRLPRWQLATGNW